MSEISWQEEKKNLRALCRKCKRPAGLHGASDGQCMNGETKFEAFKDRRTEMPDSHPKSGHEE